MAKFRNVDPAEPYTPCFGLNAVPVLPPGFDKVLSANGDDEEKEQRPVGIVRVGDWIRVTRMLTPAELKLVTKQTPQRR